MFSEFSTVETVEDKLSVVFSTKRDFNFISPAEQTGHLNANWTSLKHLNVSKAAI